MGSNVGQIALTIVGTVIGYYVGYPALGLSLGALAGQVAFPTRLDGPHTKNLMPQNASYGTMLPFGWGNFRVPGILIEQIPIVEAGTNSGKGGPVVTTYSYYGWFAVALCEGPAAVRRIWANGILIYDISSAATAATIASSIAFADKYLTFYPGDFAQNPDPILETFPSNGIGNTPAYRGTAYIVFRGIPLINYGNVLPSINAEVATSATLVDLALSFENDTSADAFFHHGSSTGIGDPALYPVITSITPVIRVCDRQSNYGPPYGPNTDGDGVVYLFDPADGAFIGTDTQTDWELAIPTWSIITGNSMSIVMLMDDGMNAVVANRPANAIYVTDATANVFVYDVYAVLVLPPVGTTGVEIIWVLPCADKQHVSVLLTSYDAGTDLNHWTLNLVSVGGTYAPTVLSSSTWSIVSTGATDIWSDTFAFTTGARFGWANLGLETPGGMLESDLIHIWQLDPYGSDLCVFDSSQTPPAQLLAAGQAAGSTTEPFPGDIGAAGAMSIWADNAVCCIVSGPRVAAWIRGGLTTVQVALSTITDALAERAGIPIGNINSSALTDLVWGFWIDRQMSARAALQAIAPAWWFDAVESDVTLKFVHRSAASVATITLDDMGADTTGKASEQPLTMVRGSEIELPTQVNLSYYALSAAYQQGMQYARRISTTQQENILSMDSAAVMDDTQAAVAAAIILWDSLAARNSFKFSTGTRLACGVPAAQLEPTDIVTIVSANEAYLARLMRKTEAAGKIDWEAVACAPVYSQSAAGGAITAGQTVSGLLLTTAIIMDIPPLRDADGATANLYVAMYGLTGWPGATLFKSSDSGVTWVAGVSQGALSTVGKTNTALGDWLGGNIFDESNTVTVRLLDATTLSSLPELSVLNGGNAALIGNEVVQFKNAVLVTGTTYVLSGFLRGRFGTEQAQAGHGIGENFVLLTGVILVQPTPTADISQPRIYQAVSAGQAVGTGIQQTITEAGHTLQCWSPVLLFATNSGAAGDIAIRWTRRNRLTWQWLPSVDVPMSEATEAYTVSIFDAPGTSVLRTISVSGSGVQHATYTSAQQTTDFGAPLDPGVFLTFGVQQISAVTGPGVMAKVTILLSNAVAPGAPTIGTAVRGNAQATVAFTAGSTGGSPITSFTATSSPGGFTASGASSPLVVTGLTNGTAYTFTVTATNAIGTGPPSAASNSVTPATVPGAPTIGTAVAGNAQADVAFTAPGSNGGSAITSYTATSSPGGFTASGSASPLTVTGLSNGTGYTFTVTATNAVGTGAASAASNSVTPSGAVTGSLLHFDDVNGSTTFTDVNSAFTWSVAAGSPAISTAQSMFGGSSLGLPGGAAIKVNAPTDPTFLPAAAFTYETWFYLNGLGAYQTLFSNNNNAGQYFLFRISNSNHLELQIWNPAYASSSGTVTSGTWHHAAVVYDGTDLTIYLDGTSTTSGPYSIGGGIVDPGAGMWVGCSQGGTFGVNGYMEDSCWHDYAKYTSNFTPSGPLTLP